MHDKLGIPPPEFLSSFGGTDRLDENSEYSNSDEEEKEEIELKVKQSAVPFNSESAREFSKFFGHYITRKTGLTDVVEASTLINQELYWNCYVAIDEATWKLNELRSFTLEMFPEMPADVNKVDFGRSLRYNADQKLIVERMRRGQKKPFKSGEDLMMDL